MHQLLAFAGLAALVILAPGPDLALITRTALAGGRSPALAVCAGTVIGILFHATIATLGVTALMAASPVAFDVLRIVGGAYLAYLGVIGLRDVRRARRTASDGEPAAEAAAVPVSTAFRQGVLSNALNPKVALFFLTFIPQFVDRRSSVPPQTIALSLTFLLLATVWHTAYALLVLRLRDFVSRASVRHSLEVATSLVLIGLGVRLGMELL